MKIVCFGDSNTYGYDPRSYLGDRYTPESCWVNILAEQLGCQAVNAGENGREIPHRKRELDMFACMLAAEQPIDLLLIMLGTNDLLQGNSVPDVALRMESFLRMIDLKPEAIILIAPQPLSLGTWVVSKTLPEASEQLNKVFKDLADIQNIHFVDAGKWNLPLTYDGVHLTQEGHRILADELFNYLKKGE